jgi:hypothetical protein
MRLGPLFIASVFYGWAFLAALAWAIAELALRREPSLARLLISLLAGGLGVCAVILAAGGGGLSLALSLPASFGASLVVCAAAGRIPTGSSRRNRRATMNPNRPRG